MSFDDSDYKKKPENGMGIPVPHPDLARNTASFEKQMSYVVWATDSVSVDVCGPTDTQIVTELDGRKVVASALKERMNVVFSWNSHGTRMTMNISFHQPNMDFQKKLCGALNRLGQRGFLVHKFKDDLGYVRRTPFQGFGRKEEKWQELFGSNA